jgi:hypothetical protein
LPWSRFPGLGMALLAGYEEEENEMVVVTVIDE